MKPVEAANLTESVAHQSKLYEALGKEDFRLLTIQPSESQDEILVDLCQASLEEEVEYEALSYCWQKCLNINPPETDPETEVEIAFQLDDRTKPNLPLKPFGKPQKIKWGDLRNHEHSWMYYQRGGLRAPEQIKCNGVSITIGGELYSALKRLRKTETARVMWIGRLLYSKKTMIIPLIRIRRYLYRSKQL